MEPVLRVREQEWSKVPAHKVRRYVEDVVAHVEGIAPFKLAELVNKEIESKFWGERAPVQEVVNHALLDVLVSLVGVDWDFYDRIVQSLRKPHDKDLAGMKLLAIGDPKYRLAARKDVYLRRRPWAASDSVRATLEEVFSTAPWFQSIRVDQTDLNVFTAAVDITNGSARFLVRCLTGLDGRHYIQAALESIRMNGEQIIHLGRVKRQEVVGLVSGEIFDRAPNRDVELATLKQAFQELLAENQGEFYFETFESTEDHITSTSNTDEERIRRKLGTSCESVVPDALPAKHVGPVEDCYQELRKQFPKLEPGSEVFLGDLEEWLKTYQRGMHRVSLPAMERRLLDEQVRVVRKLEDVVKPQGLFRLTPDKLLIDKKRNASFFSDQKKYQRGEKVRRKNAPFDQGYVWIDYGNSLVDILFVDERRKEVKMKTMSADELETLGQVDVETMEKFYERVVTDVTGRDEPGGSSVVIEEDGVKYAIRKVGDAWRIYAGGQEVYSSQHGETVQGLVGKIRSHELDPRKRAGTMVAATLAFPSFVQSLKGLRGLRVKSLLNRVDKAPISEGEFFGAARECLGPRGWAKLAALAKARGIEVPKLDHQYLVDLGQDMQRRGASSSEVLWELSKPYYGLTAAQATGIIHRVFSTSPVATLFTQVLNPKDIRPGDKVHLATGEAQLPWGSLVTVESVSKDKALVACQGKTFEVLTKDLMHPRVFVKGQSVRAYVNYMWRNATIEKAEDTSFVVATDGNRYRVSHNYVRYSDDRLEDRAIEYGFSLMEKFELEEAMAEVQRRFKLNPSAFRRVEQYIQKHSTSPTLAFGSKVLVTANSRVLKGRFVKAQTNNMMVVQFADGQGVVASSLVKAVPLTEVKTNQCDFVCACEKAEQAQNLLASLRQAGIEAQSISQMEVVAAVPEEQEEDFYELAYDQIPLERVSKQPVDMALIEASRPFELDQVDGDVLAFKPLKVGDRAEHAVVNRFSREVLIPEGHRFSEADLSVLQVHSSNRLFRADEGQLTPFGEEPASYQSDPFLTREVYVALKSAQTVPDDIISLKDGSLFLEKNTPVTEGIRVAMRTAGPLAFVESFHDKYMGYTLQPEIQLSYEITSVRKAVQDESAVDFAIRLMFAASGQKYTFDLSTDQNRFVKNGVFDEVAFQVSILNKMVRAGIDEGAAYRFMKSPQYAMLQADLATKISGVLEKEVELASFSTPEKSRWLSTAFVNTVQELDVLGVNTSSRREVVGWMAENKNHPGFSDDVFAFVRRITDFEYDRVRQTFF